LCADFERRRGGEVERWRSGEGEKRERHKDLPARPDEGRVLAGRKDEK